MVGIPGHADTIQANVALPDTDCTCCTIYDMQQTKKSTAKQIAVLFLMERRLLRAALVFAGTCIDFDLVALVNKQWHRNREASCDLRWFHDFT